MAIAGNNKVILIIAAVSIVGSVGAAVGTGIFLAGRNKAAAPSAHSAEADEPPKQHHAKPPETIHPLGEMVINLADNGDLRYVKISVAVGIEEKLEDTAIKPYEPLLKDSVIQVVSRRRFAELRKAEGLDELKKDLLEAMAGRIPKATLVQVYLEGFAMQ